jgi:hypothetical protein
MNGRKLGIISLLGGITTWNACESVKYLIDYYQTSNDLSLFPAAFYGVGTLILGGMTAFYASIRDDEYNALEREAMQREKEERKRRKWRKYYK